MDIVHFVENLERGGLERTVVDLVAAQREMGHRCRVVCLYEPGQLAAELQAQGVEVEACRKRGGLDWRAMRRVRAALAHDPRAVLHTHNAAAHYHAVLATAGMPLACVVNTRHGMGAIGLRNRQEWLYRRSMVRTDYVVGVCEAVRRRFAGQGVRPRGALLAIPNGIRLERFVVATPGARATLAEELGWPVGSLVIGTVGRLHPVKDQARLLHALHALRSRIPQAVLAVIGDGPLRVELEREACALGLGDAVRFLGDRDDVPRLLAGMHAFALPSRSEGYSVALLEACAAALPIVATDVGGNADIVRDGINGRLVAAGDTIALASALRELCVDAEGAERMGRAGREWVITEGSFQTMAMRYQRVYARERMDQNSAAVAA